MEQKMEKDNEEFFQLSKLYEEMRVPFLKVSSRLFLDLMCSDNFQSRVSRI